VLSINLKDAGNGMQKIGQVVAEEYLSDGNLKPLAQTLQCGYCATSFG